MLALIPLLLLSQTDSVPGVAAVPELAAEQKPLLAAWFKAVGERRKGEAFGDLVVRVAETQMGRAYYDAPQTDQPETLRIELKTLQCVSLVEGSLALARCVWRGDANEVCFLREVEGFRYRDGRLNGYASRLHYFTEWLEDNARRGRLRLLTDEIKAKPTAQVFSYMSANPKLYPALKNPEVLKEIKEAETRLSAAPHAVVDRNAIATAQKAFKNGDIIGLVSDKHPGMVIIHTGFIYVGKSGKRQLLHAGATHKRVLITASDVADYVTRRPERLGLMVARPVEP